MQIYRGTAMTIKRAIILIACAFVLSGCETISSAWHDVFGLNNDPTSSARPLIASQSGASR